MKQFLKRYGIFLYTGFIVFALVFFIFFYEIPEAHPRRNEKIFYKWAQIVFWGIILAEQLTKLRNRFFRPASGSGMDRSEQGPLT